MAKKKKNQDQDALAPVNQEEAKEDLKELVSSEANETKLVEDNEEHLIAVPVDSIPLNIALPCSVYIKVADRFPLFRKQGEKLTGKRIVSLSEKGANALYIHKAVWKLFIGSLEKNALAPDSPPAVVAQHIRSLIIAYGTELEKKIKEPKKPIFEKLRILSEALAGAISRDASIGTSLLRKSTDPQLYFVNHSVNVAVYSTVIGVQAKVPFNDLRQLTYGGLVHDIGDLFLPKTLLFKKSELTEDETAFMQTHTRKGAELLQTFGSSPGVVLSALQHHETMDGEGYPQNLDGSDIHIFARIIGIADTYDALTSQRPYQPAISPREAIEKMKTMSGKFDPAILRNVVGETPSTQAAPAVKKTA